MSSKEISLLNDEPITPYRSPTPPVVYKEPRDYAPIKRAGKIGLVILPWLLMIVLTPILGGMVIGMGVIYLPIAGGVSLIGSVEDRHATRMKWALIGLYWPISLLVFLAYNITYPFKRAHQYIKSGE